MFTFKLLEKYTENRKLKKKAQNNIKNHKTFQQLENTFTFMSFVA